MIIGMTYWTTLGGRAIVIGLAAAERVTRSRLSTNAPPKSRLQTRARQVIAMTTSGR